jgi:phosphate-selective porin
MRWTLSLLSETGRTGRGRSVRAAALALGALLLFGRVSFGQDKAKTETPSLAISKAFKLSGYTQVQYVDWKTGVDSFSVRRSRLTLSGDILKNMRYKLQVDVSKTFTLLDAVVEYEFSKLAQLRVGQFLLPFSQENLTSVADLDVINRSQVEEKLAPGRDNSAQGRDAGVALFGSQSIFEYTVGVFNGAGINKADVDNRKDIGGRVVLHPLSELSVGGSFYLGKQHPAAGSPLVRRDKYGLEMALLVDRASLKAEYIAAKDDIVSKNGWYVQGGYFVVAKKIQAVLRYDVLDVNTSISGDRVGRTTAGLNWVISGKTKIQVNYENYRSQSGKADNQALLAQFQVSY